MTKGSIYRRLERLEARVGKTLRLPPIFKIMFCDPNGSVSTEGPDGQYVWVVPPEGFQVGDISADSDYQPYDRDPGDVLNGPNGPTRFR